MGDYVIPRGYHIYLNLWAVHHDPKYWKQPDVFDPDRFLNEDKTKLIKRDSFIPFAVGKRQCPGESLAQIELFMYVAYFLQRFEVCAHDGIELNDKGAMAAFSYVPDNLELVFKPRR